MSTRTTASTTVRAGCPRQNQQRGQRQNEEQQENPPPPPEGGDNKPQGDPSESKDPDEPESEEEPNQEPEGFSLTPGTSYDGVLNYQTKEARTYYGYATKALEEEPYDCNPEGFYGFIQTLKTRASEYGWDDPDSGVLQIPLDYRTREEEKTNILDEYGMMDLKALTRYERTYIHTQSRLAQDGCMLFECLINSISKVRKAKISIWQNHYVVRKKPSGICLLKVLIRESHLDTNATTSMI